MSQRVDCFKLVNAKCLEFWVKENPPLSAISLESIQSQRITADKILCYQPCYPIHRNIIGLAEKTWVLAPERLMHEVVTCVSLFACPII
jgi:hypothetical protein